MRRGAAYCCALYFVVIAAGCRSEHPAAVSSTAGSTLTIGYGLTEGARTEQAANLITQEGLVNIGLDGRPVPWLAESWSTSADGLTLRIVLKPNVTFHDGTALTSAVVRDALQQQLPAYLGPSFQDIQDIQAASPNEVVVVLKNRSSFLLESLNMLLHSPTSNAGTGPFYVASENSTDLHLQANEKYRSGRPLIDHIVIRPYPTTRAAWADMLRGQVDMVYEIGSEAFDLTQPANQTRLFTYQRHYAYIVVLNLRRRDLQDAAFRKALTSSVSRDTLVSKALDGHGRPADSPMWPEHWAYDKALPHFQYAPSALSKPRSFTLMYSDPSDERMAVFIQQQLQDVGVNVRLELSSIVDALKRVNAGDFDAWLADVGLGPSFARQSLFWHTGSPYNWGHYSNAKVDAALDAIKGSRTDEEYRAGAAAFQEAMIDDPPAIFLAWSERARAVSTRFEVQSEPARDILSTMRLWRPVMPTGTAHN
jgi:peptide/nickel transport system substrate-binding protein